MKQVSGLEQPQSLQQCVALSTWGVTSKVAVSVSTEVMFGLHCDLVLRKANFVVPDIVDVLGRYTSECSEESCSHQVVRLDSNVQEVLNLNERDVVLFGLQSDVIYKFRGYVDPSSQESTFVVQAVEQIL